MTPVLYLFGSHQMLDLQLLGVRELILNLHAVGRLHVLES